ncbi:FecCD family ABC transporter permease [Rhodovibrio salinarum]|uniref:Heme ABC transporter permease n=1 Tax=Rhodovibrio salinarum TaxID=1087 RepID=A0A934QK72_9PROT|nr:iron chelate uptake ABC transporter family permease subunit [Rhodovibrio salinarum]MBK1698214.1 heme ABC transporter permease [Rhodovibrio salinarum]
MKADGERISTGVRSVPSAYLGMLACLLTAMAAFLLAVGYGAVAIPPGDVLRIVGTHLGLGSDAEVTRVQETVLLAIRLPRAVLGGLVGAGLAVAGAALQGLFRNPLADPALIGVSNGAALAAAATIVVGSAGVLGLPAWLIPHLLPVSAFLGGVAATWLVYMIASRDGTTEVAVLLLAGVALNAIVGAAIGLLIFLSDDQELRDLNFWLLGSLGGATWERIAVAAPLILVPSLLLIFQGRRLNALLLGEFEAGHLGVAVEQTKRRIVLFAAMAVGASVALAGVIGFVGLVVPHLIRLLIGPDHRTLLPATLFLGAALLLLADILARTVALPAELPIGILTSTVGGPFFLWLLLRQRTQWVM